MRLNIASLVGRKGAFFQVTRELSSAFAEGASDVSRVLGPILATLRVTNTGEGYLVKGDLSLEVELLCSRCLRPLKTTLETFFEEEFVTRSEERDDDLFWDEEPLVEGNELDTTSLIEESILMSIPMKPVCQKDCPGLCPSCGAFLAGESCDCISPEIDIRLAPLSKLLQTKSEATTPERRKDHGSSKEKTFKSKD